MELVYLWVEKYKNIEKQGFNFSPRFECKFYDEYDEDGKLKDDCKLVICDKKNEVLDEKAQKCKPCKDNNYIENFFGDNVNITAIAGENGSGKSSLFEILGNIVLEKKMQEKYIILYIEDNMLYISNIDNIAFKFENIAKQKVLKNAFAIYFSSSFSNGAFIDTYDLFATPLYSVVNTETRNKEYKNNYLKNQSLLNLFFNSSRIISDHKADSLYYQKDAFTIKDMIEEYNISKAVVILNFLRLFDKNYLPVDINFINNITISLSSKKNSMEGQNYIEVFQEYFKLKTEDECIGFDYDEYRSSIDQEKYLNAYKNLMSFLTSIKIHNVDKHDDIKLSFNDSLIFLQLYMVMFSLNSHIKKSFIRISFPDLSSGEENLFLMFALLEIGIKSFYRKDEKVEKKIILLLDEIENSFHPQWQKNILVRLLPYLNLINEHIFNNQLKYHIVFNSHSSFLLSDIPKENIIFLEKYKEDDIDIKSGKQKVGNCKNVTKEIDIETFGANIHTLLSHGFFMKDGLMGEFAKGKIENIRKFYNKVILYKDDAKYKTKYKCLYEKKQKEFWHIQKIIGEPFLQTIVKNQLEEIETILFQDKAQDIQIQRYIEEFGADKIREVLDGKA